MLADGRVVDTSETEKTDLFWAIRGAGHNFGVTVEFFFRAYPQLTTVYAGLLVFTPDKLDVLIVVLNERHATANPRAAFQCVFAVPPGPGPSNPVVIVVCFYNGDKVSAKEYLTSVLEVGPVANTLRSIAYAQMNGLLNDMAQPGGRKSLKGVTFSSPVRKEFAQWLFRQFATKIAREPDLVQSFLTIEFYDLAKTVSIPIGATSFPNRDEYQTGIIGLSWSNPTKDAEFRSCGRCLQAKCREKIRAHGPHLSSNAVLEYANYTERKSFCPDCKSMSCS